MESSTSVESDSQKDFYDVAEHEMIDLIKIEPEEENDGEEDNNEEFDPEVSQPSSDFPLSKESLHFIAPSMEEAEAETEFHLKFDNHSESEVVVKVNQANILQLDGERLIKRTFDVIIRRRNYPIVPVKWYTTEGLPSTPFEISEQGIRKLTYCQIDHPKDGDVIHEGARVTVENGREILITFHCLSTYLTREERDIHKIRMHKGKKLELLCLDPETGDILGSLPFQVCAEPRNLSAQKVAAQKRKQTGGTHPPIGNNQDEDSLTSDTGDDVTSRMATIERLHQLMEKISNKNLSHIEVLATSMAEN